MATVVSVPCVADKLCRDTVRAVVASGYPYRFVFLNPDDDAAYGQWWRRVWARGETVIVCEHDVVPTKAQLATVQRCGHGWCSFAYHGSMYPRGPMFGLVRVADRTMHDHPFAADVALEDGERRPEPVPWWNVDSAMARDLMIRGVQWHEHLPPVTHLHPGRPSGPP